MPRSIRDVLPQRRDFSPLLVHLTRGQGEGEDRRTSARRNLWAMLRSGVIEARKPYGLTRRCLDGEVPPGYFHAVCLTDTPPEELSTVIGDIRARGDRLDNYGLVFSKRFIMEAGGSPVIYLCTQQGNELVDAFVWLAQKGFTSRRSLRRMAPLLLLMESFGPGYFDQRRLVDFHWEREWRVAGDLNFELDDVLLGICDQRDIERMEEHFRPLRFIDPLASRRRWGRKVKRARDRAWEDYLEPFPE